MNDYPQKILLTAFTLIAVLAIVVFYRPGEKAEKKNF